MAFFTVTESSGLEWIVPIEPGQSLAQHLFQQGAFVGKPLCAGLGRCGLCRVSYHTPAPDITGQELRILTTDEADGGVRLSCRHFPRPGDSIALPPEAATKVPREPPLTVDAPMDLAVDLGTTTVKWAAIQGREWVRSGRFPNPQLGAGSEVMSRLAYARQNVEKRRYLRDLVRKQIVLLAQDLGVGTREMCVAGNTAMLFILLDRDLEGLCAAPYHLDFAGGRECALDGDLPTAYVPPLLGPFVGADVTAGLAWLLQDSDPGYPFLYADLGTNGEFVLALGPTNFLATSVPLGPALEGCGLSFGTMAETGAVAGFRLTSQGLTAIRQGQGACSGITATGYVSLLSNLLQAGAMDRNGVFVSRAASLAGRITTSLRLVRGEQRLSLEEGMYLAGSDVEELLKIKSAFNTALESLLQKAGIGFSRIKGVHLAGALGEHLKAKDLETLGFIPPGTGDLIRVAGPAALRGAALLARDHAFRRTCEETAGTVALLDLPSARNFGREFIRRIVFEYI
ncbi:MAG: ASKHA domain-containing protein [Desulfohalobiaceae bacterium]